MGAWPALPAPQFEAPVKLHKASWFRRRLAFRDAHGHSPWAAKGGGWVESHSERPSLPPGAHSLTEGRKGLREPWAGKWAVTPHRGQRLPGEGSLELGFEG